MSGKRFLVGIAVLLGMAEVHADFFATGKIAYFRPCQDKFRDIYSTGGGMFGVEASGLVGGHVYFWGSGDYFHASGSSNPPPTVSTTSTHVTMVPIAIGLKYLYHVSFADFYLGAGFAETWLQIRGISPFTTKTRSQWGPGGMFKAGAVFNVKHHVILDFFTNYLLTSMQLEHGRSKANVSGWSVGVGLGFRLGPRPK